MSSLRAVRSVLTVVALIIGVTPAGAASPVIEQSYIVVFEDGVSDARGAAAELARGSGGKVGFVYEHALRGFSVTTTPAGAAALARNPNVAYVESDHLVRIAAQAAPTGIERIFADGDQTIDGLDDLRVDVDVAVIDTGIDLDHPDLNVVGSTNCSGGSPLKMSCGSGGNDDNGHGTHVAGTIGALDNDQGVVGVAPGARLWSVKVLRSDGSGYLSWIIAGVDWVTARAGQIEVANMSLGGAFTSASFDTALTNSVAAGVAYAVAAGNDDQDAAGFSPANHPDVLTVSALADFDGQPGGLGSPTCRTDQDDTLADFSNWGNLVEIAAPGVCIRSTWLNGGYNTISGTSMASPHAAGALALLASGSGDPTNGTQVKGLYQTLINNGNLDWADDSGDGTKEPLLDVSNAVFNPRTVAGSGGGGDTNAAPSASFTYSCADLGCSFDGSGSSDSDGTIASFAWTFGDGNTANGVTVAHTYGADGSYTVTLTVTDDDGATGSASQSVMVSSGDGEVSLTGSSVNNGSTWTAIVTDTSGAELTGSWSYAGTASCSANECTLSGIPKRQGSVTFTAASTGEQITISKP